MIKNVIKRLFSIRWNLLSNLSGYQLTYVVEACDWSIKNDGQSITCALNRQTLLRARISYSPIGLRNQIVHFGSVNTFFRHGRWHKAHSSNKPILTWFHVVPNDPRLKLIKQAQQDLHLIHTSCQKTKNDLIAAGVDDKKIVVIPLGVDTTLFTPATDEEKKGVRSRLGINQNRLVIGSFQKDGVGWDEGLKPKLIKGPDVLVETIARLKHLNPFVLLTGPARGYVKRGLEQNGIDYKHVYVKTVEELPKMYNALDLYLITSRIEGGPKSILEAWASGVPVVSTQVGMVPDIAEHNKTALLVEIENLAGISQQANRLLTDDALKKQLANTALVKVKKYDWNQIAFTYNEKIYSVVSPTRISFDRSL